MEEIYQAKLIAAHNNPNNNHKVISATHSGEHNNHVCGDVITIELRIKDGEVKDAGWKGKGCLLCTSSASLLTEHIKNKKMEEVSKIAKDDLQEIIGIKTPESRDECILTPLIAIKNALEKNQDNKNE